MRYTFEIQGVIDANTQAEADALAERIAADGRDRYKFGTPDNFPPNAVVATCDVEVVTPKRPLVAVAS